MTRLCLCLLFFLGVTSWIRAAETDKSDHEFVELLDKIKSPFDSGLAKPQVPESPPSPNGDAGPGGGQPGLGTLQQRQMAGMFPGTGPNGGQAQPKPAVDTPPPEPIVLPVGITLQGVLVGEDMHQAIINDQIVPVNGSVMGARLEEVNKEGVVMEYKGKKFLLKIE